MHGKECCRDVFRRVETCSLTEVDEGKITDIL